MVDGVTGMLVEADVESIIKAVGIISKGPGIYKNGGMERAKSFDKFVFIKRMKDVIGL
jgi:hypothetical protein